MGRTTDRTDGETYLPERPGFLKNIPTWELQHLQDNVEHELFESVIAEFTDISGISADYYMLDPEVNRNMDRLYGETTRTSYLQPRQIKLIYEPTEEITMTNTFGIVSEEMIQYSATPKITFARDVSAGYQPLPGDVIITHWNNRAYEIVDVAEEEKIFQLKKMIWSFVLKPYRFSEDSDISRTIPMGRETGPLDTDPLSAYGDNRWIEEQSDAIHDYPDVDESIYGY